ncbi:MAG: metalloregulator ArsR/SmtB family transcription factor [Gammaproteobacteria bacterium]|nr:metalloregulator ArsR/SmtB family transcription factor [Gammaproteobacteria bacterium]
MNPAKIFKALSEPTRLRCLFLLVKEDELCVCELTHALALPQPKVSHHLANLRKAELVCDRKDGLWIYYRLNPELPQWVLEMIHATAEGIKNEEPFVNDALALAKMSNSSGGVCSALGQP